MTFLPKRDIVKEQNEFNEELVINMGQAKKRGDFETRKAQSVEAKRVASERVEEEARKWFENLTEEEKETYRKQLKDKETALRRLGLWTAAVAGLGV